MSISKDAWQNIPRMRRLAVLMRNPEWWLLAVLVTICLPAERLYERIIQPLRNRADLLSHKVIGKAAAEIGRMK